MEGKQYDIEIKIPKGEIKKLHFTHSKAKETELSSKPLPQKGNFEFRWLKDNVAYAAIRTFDDASVVADFESRLSELRKAKKIILDVRNNGGGNGKNALNIVKYFVKTDTIYGARNYSREIIPTERAIGSFLTAQDTISGKPQCRITKEEDANLYKAYFGSKFHNYDYKPTILHTDINLQLRQYCLPIAIPPLQEG